MSPTPAVWTRISGVRLSILALLIAIILYISSPLTTDNVPTNSVLNYLNDWRHPSECSPGQISHGKWKRREVPIQTIEDVRTAWGFPPDAWVTCPAFTLMNDTKARTIEVADWEWEPFDQRDGKCRATPWTRDGMAIRMLRAKHGLILVGDSLTEHATSSYVRMFQYPGSPYLVRGIGLIYTDIRLDPDHPETLRLLREARVPSSRLNTPILTWWRHHHLLSVEELGLIHKGIDTFKFDHIPKEPDWWPLYLIDRSLAYSLPDVNSVTVPGYIEPSAKATKTERDVVILNVGPHWHYGELGRTMSAEDQLMGYERMVTYINDRFSRLQPAVNLYWRTVAPGHMQCEQYITAEPERNSQASTLNPQGEAFNWMMIPEMNEILTRLLSYDVNRPKADHNNQLTNINMVDTWAMSIQRPEAHLNPGGDCLHYCPIGVTSYWNQLHWQSILYDSVYSDYVR